jgi:hypothetical protein
LKLVFPHARNSRGPAVVRDTLLLFRLMRVMFGHPLPRSGTGSSAVYVPSVEALIRHGLARQNGAQACRAGHAVGLRTRPGMLVR